MDSTYTVSEPTNPDTKLVPMGGREVFVVMISGFAVGALVAVAYILLNKYVFGSVLCRLEGSAECGKAPVYAEVTAQVIGIIIGVAALVRLRVYRPLLVILATAVTLWSLSALIGGVHWYESVIFGGVLFGLAYGLYTWLARIRSLILAITLILILVVVARLVTI
ncbi:MAG: hypothetical protein ABI397_01625 [Candidatus Saccharimonas sp.]